MMAELYRVDWFKSREMVVNAVMVVFEGGGELGALAADATGQLDVLGHDGDLRSR